VTAGGRKVGVGAGRVYTPTRLRDSAGHTERILVQVRIFSHVSLQLLWWYILGGLCMALKWWLAVKKRGASVLYSTVSTFTSTALTILRGTCRPTHISGKLGDCDKRLKAACECQD